MITIEELRTLMSNSDKRSDAEMKRAREIMYGFADAIFERWLRKRNKQPLRDEEKSAILYLVL